MGFFKRFFGGASAKPEKRYHTFSVKCLRCGEIIEGRVDLDNDLSVEYESSGDVYIAHKMLMGANRCFQRIEVDLKFTYNRELIEQEVKGGEFV